MRMHIATTRSVLPVLAALTMLFAAAAPSASAAAPKWRISTSAQSQAKEGETFTILGEFQNVGDAALEGSTPGHPIVISGELPSGLELTPPGPGLPAVEFEELGPGCVETLTSFTCTDESTLPATARAYFRVRATVQAGASGVLTSLFEVKGGDSSEPSHSLTDPTTVSAETPSFGLEAFDVQNTADAFGTTFSQAGGHPFGSATTVVLRARTKPGFLNGPGVPVEPAKDIVAELPPGFIANASAAAKCELVQLAHGDGNYSRPLCPPESQVGTVALGAALGFRGTGEPGVPLFNMEVPPGVPARLGFGFANVTVVLDASLRNGGDYGVDVISRNISGGIPLAGTTLDVWGVPASPAHDRERACRGEFPPLAQPGVATCESEAEEVAFMRLPTSCADEATGMPFTVHADSWFHPGDFDSRTIRTHNAPGYPLPAEPSTFPAAYTGPTQWGSPQGPTGCEDVPFEPSISIRPTTHTADTPTGLEVDLEVPQENLLDPEAISSSDLKDATVTLPKGLAVNPSSASGLEACTPAQIGLLTPVGDQPPRFNDDPSCPAGSKIGTVDVETPLLEEHVEGSVYLAQQGQNPFGSFLAVYLVARANGVLLTLPGKISPQADGRLSTTFSNQPQLPFSHLHLSFFGGPRAALRTPPACGTYTSQAKLTPWSGNAPVDLTSSFEITDCPNSGFDPKFSAGTQNPLAGAYSPFSLRLTREDGTEELAGLKLAVPEGLLANLKGIPYCPDSVLAAISGELGTGAAQIASPSCPTASQVGTVTAGAGAGPNPFFSTTGKVYWAGPYKGAPVSLAAVVPAVAGPFDLGNVLVRNRFEVDPETAEITAVSDPFPAILHGIPLDLRDVRIHLNRPNYTLNPTSCEPMSFAADLSGAQGSHAQRSERFQVAGCERLGFKPRLRLRLSGATKRSGHPALRAILTMPSGGANIARASVALPRSAFLAQDHIRTICTRVQYAADRCPKRSIYGYARAYSPILDYYLQGPVYLRSSNNALPDLVAHLGGQIEIDVVGRIDSARGGGIRTTFESLPDAPVSKFVLEMPGGRRSLIENSVNTCRNPQRARALFDAHNGKTRELRPALKPSCGKKKGKKRGYR
jgi:hypothetical protein